MDDPRLQSGIHSGTYLEDWIHTSYSRILKCCLCTGLASSEADDIAQDIWLWLLREGSLDREISMSWLAAVARNFILRYRRRKYRRSTLEECWPDPEPRTQEVLRELEVEDLLDRVAAALPETERRMLVLIRSGHSLAESARLLGVPRGSRGYYQSRLVACARRELARKGGSTSRRTGCQSPGSHLHGRKVTKVKGSRWGEAPAAGAPAGGSAKGPRPPASSLAARIAPAARASSLDHLGRLRAPRTEASRRQSCRAAQTTERLRRLFQGVGSGLGGLSVLCAAASRDTDGADDSAVHE